MRWSKAAPGCALFLMGMLAGAVAASAQHAFGEVDKPAFMGAAQAGGMDEWFVKQFGAEPYKRIKETR